MTLDWFTQFHRVVEHIAATAFNGSWTADKSPEYIKIDLIINNTVQVWRSIPLPDV